MKNLSLQLEQRYRLPVDTKNNSSNNNKNIITGLVVCDRTLDDDDDNNKSPCRAVLTRDGHVVFCRLDHNNNANNNNTNNNTERTDVVILWDCDLKQVLEGDNPSSQWQQQQQQQQQQHDDDWFQLDLVEGHRHHHHHHHYCNNNYSLIALQRGGAIVAITPNTGQAELVGEFDNGIDAAAWSPDGEVLLLVTTKSEEEEEDTTTTTAATTTSPPNNNNNNNHHHHHHKTVMLTLNNQWEVLAEVEIEPHAPDHPVLVTWRPDGTLCAVSSVDVSDQIRKIRIYQQHTLQLHGIGRTEDGSGKLVPNLLASDLAWAGPACSQLLATIQQQKSTKSSKLQVAFFESNGLRHREFVLSSSSDNKKNETVQQQQVTAMEWNTESDLLAIALKVVITTPILQNEQQQQQQDLYQNKVQLWHRSNYHWYLKHEFVYSNDHEQNITYMQFHPQHAYTLMVGFSTGHWKEYTVRWHASTVMPTIIPSSSSSLSLSSSSTAVCIDGCQLQWTPLHRAIIPPPMSAATLTLAEAVSEVVFSTTDGRAVVVLSNGTLVVFRAEENVPKIKGIRGWKVPTVLATYSSSGSVSAPQHGGLDLSSLRNLAIVASSDQSVRLVGACWSIDDSGIEKFVVLLISWNGPDGSNCKLTVEDTMVLDAPILAITPWADCDQGALVELEDGQLLEWESVGSSLTPSEAELLLEPCPWIAALKFPSKLEHYHQEQNGHHHHHHGRTRLVFGKSPRGRFYCHDLLLADSISSFTLSMTQQFLCYASAESRCQLRFLPLTELASFDPLMGSDEHHTLLGYEPRNIERGSRLVAVFQDEPAAVLQMPRGNLEVVYPRALVLRHVMLRIMERKYSDAFETMRRQKVDLNLIVDMDPVHFLNDEDGAPLFFDQVQSVDYLNLFLSLLQNWDSTQDRYPVPHWIRVVETNNSPGIDDFDFSSKVNRVCQRMRSVMIEAEKNGRTLSGKEVKEGDFLLPILSTFAKESPPKLEEALQLIKENAIRHQTTSSSSKPPLFADKAQHSIQYLAFLAEYELLFDCALGLYDYDIARAVARNSQMDPKMYLPLLKRYRELPECYARYEVDMRLRRYERALRNLAKSRDVGENLDSVTLPPDQESIRGNSLGNCMGLIEEHGLHRLGLELFQDAKSVQQIMISLGDRMLKGRKASTALSMFLAAPELDGERALKAAKAAREWRTYFSLLSTTRSDSGETEFDEEQQRMIAREIADNLAADAQGSMDRRKLLESAARILLDYGKDIVGAVDMLIAAEMWDEGQRLVYLYRRNEMEQRCLDAAISYAQSTMTDLEDRSETFQKTMARYLVVLRIRKEAIASGEAEDLPESNEQDETGSLFSAASNVSNTSLSSTASTGSAGSLSSVISAKSTSSFSITGAQESGRHKSKYNQLGSKPKKKKKKKRDKKGTRARPGSHAELLNLVETLRLTCLDDVYRMTIAETIAFLSRNRSMSTARALFDSYAMFCKQLSMSQQERIESVRQDRLEQEARIRREGGQLYPTLTVESEVETLGPVDLPIDVTDLFALLPDTTGSISL